MQKSTVALTSEATCFSLLNLQLFNNHLCPGTALELLPRYRGALVVSESDSKAPHL